ncbi:MAG: UDP-N-acetylglucosamine 2-epimerase (non-hydrolyzing) [Firmicutes bacterium]|nr:UDP-N-acetylglucosamine 2-epimerase (non-hydrolyzing) [Bacillota bacterium]
MKILSVFGTRPEAIKMAPLIQALEKTPGMDSVVAVTAQHRQMLDQVMQLFSLKADYDFDLMRHGQTVSSITQAVLQKMDPVLEKEKPDLVLVHGDTTTTFAAALAAFYRHIPIGHVEAGLRSGDKAAPFPEEINRKLTDAMADWFFAPTQTAAGHLKAENIPEDRIFITGNTVIDALLQVTAMPEEDYPWLRDIQGKRLLTLTCHRRENWGEPMRQIFAAIRRVLLEKPDCRLIFPAHLNPLVQQQAHAAFDDLPQARIIAPLDYQPFAVLMKKSDLIITDSGGLQEEAPALGKPVLVLRQVTERPEAIAAGTADLAGVTFDSVYAKLSRLLEDEALYRRMSHAANPYGDGHAAEQICAILQEHVAPTLAGRLEA